MRITTKIGRLYVVPLPPAPEARVIESFILVDKEFPQSRGMTDKQFYEAMQLSITKYFDKHDA